jgi:hypothetical protein
MPKSKRPPLDITDVTETLKQSKGQGMDAFFSTPPNQENDNSQVTADTPPPHKQAEQHHETIKEVSDDVMTSLRHDVLHGVNIRRWRDIIENTETRNSSLRLTTKEADDIEDLITELKRKLKVKTSLNEVARLGLLYLLHDFKKNRANSLIYKVKKS